MTDKLSITNNSNKGVFMSHEIFQTRFVSHRQPAWHQLGMVFDQPLNAEEAFALMGQFDVVKEPLYRLDTGSGIRPANPVPVKGKYVLTGHFPEHTGFDQITHPATSHHYGVVDERYELVSPKQLTQLWDMLVKANIETMGTLQQGKRFFLTTKLESFDIKGDQHENYLSVFSPHGTNQCIIGLISPVRTVCMNTYQMAIGAAKEEYKVPHMKGAMNKIGAWMQAQYESVQQRSAEVQAALNVLAGAKATNEDRDTYLEQVFPMDVDAALEVQTRTQDARTDVGMLYEGMATGADAEAFKGSYYGLYNSVVEYLDYNRKRTRKEARWVGPNGSLKEKAFDLALEMAGV
jgi:phage/plasmid-like protein (TIGR03299 family)